MREIISRQNEEVKSVARLQTQKGRQELKKFIAEGARTCQALLDSDKYFSLLQKVYCTSKMLDQAVKITSKNNQNPEIILVADAVMEKISNATTPSGILCVFNMPKCRPENQLTSGIVLEGISDPGNMGTMIRTCAAMGFKSVVLIDCMDVYSPKVIQASAGEIGKVNIFDISLQELIKNKKNLKLIALVASNGKRPKDVNFNNCLLVIGSEAHGISQEFVDQCDEKMTLEMPGKTESLNACVAGSIAMYLASSK